MGGGTARERARVNRWSQSFYNQSRKALAYKSLVSYFALRLLTPVHSAYRMKRQPVRFLFSKATSFTLVELLVVIGIIAILASVVLAGATSVIKKAQRVKAATTANSIVTGVTSYYTEYSVYPIPGDISPASSDFIIGDSSAGAGDWANLLYGLCGNLNTSTGSSTPAPSSAVANTRGIAFLTMKKSDVDVNDAPLNPLPSSPTSNIYFNIAIDGNYDGIIGGTPPNGGTTVQLPNLSAGVTTSGGICTSGVAVWANCNGSTTSTNAAFWVWTY